MHQSMQKTSLCFFKAFLFTRTQMRASPLFLYFLSHVSVILSLISRRNQKMALLREQLVMSVCKIETGKVSPPARLPIDSSYQSWAPLLFPVSYVSITSREMKHSVMRFSVWDNNSSPFWVHSPIRTDKMCCVCACVMEHEWGNILQQAQLVAQWTNFDDLSIHVFLFVYSLFSALKDNLKSFVPSVTAIPKMISLMLYCAWVLFILTVCFSHHCFVWNHIVIR